MPPPDELYPGGVPLPGAGECPRAGPAAEAELVVRLLAPPPPAAPPDEAMVAEEVEEVVVLLLAAAVLDLGVRWVVTPAGFVLRRTFFVLGSLLSFLYFIRRFWNQILICLSDRHSACAISILLRRVR